MLLPATSADAATNNYDSGYLTISANGIPPVGHSASAQWFQPAGTSENSSVLFWVGVGGLGSPGASTGTAADCSGGSPVYYAWYRAPGSSAVVPYGGVIGANDGISASVSCGDTSCTMQLEAVGTVDSAHPGQDWTTNTTQPLSGTPQHAEAMISKTSRNLTNFGTVEFDDVKFNGVVATPSDTLSVPIEIGGYGLDSIGALNTIAIPYPTGHFLSYFTATWLRAS